MDDDNRIFIDEEIFKDDTKETEFVFIVPRENKMVELLGLLEGLRMNILSKENFDYEKLNLVLAEIDKNNLKELTDKYKLIKSITLADVGKFELEISISQ